MKNTFIFSFRSSLREQGIISKDEAQLKVNKRLPVKFQNTVIPVANSLAT